MKPTGSRQACGPGTMSPRFQSSVVVGWSRPVAAGPPTPSSGVEGRSGPTPTLLPNKFRWAAMQPAILPRVWLRRLVASPRRRAVPNHTPTRHMPRGIDHPRCVRHICHEFSAPRAVPTERAIAAASTSRLVSSKSTVQPGSSRVLSLFFFPHPPAGSRYPFLPCPPAPVSPPPMACASPRGPPAACLWPSTSSRRRRPPPRSA
jgi:hypothetical protein